MKIAFLNFFGGQHNRGVETFVDELASRLTNKNDVTVFQSNETSADHKYKITVLDSGSNWKQSFNKYSLGWRFYLDYWNRQIAKFTIQSLSKIDLKTDVVVTVNGGWQTLIIRIWTWFHGIKMIVSGQSGPGWGDRVNLLFHPDVFVALSTHQAKWAKFYGFGTKIALIPNGVNLDVFSPKVKKIDLGLPRPVIICPAAIEDDKNIKQTIESVTKAGETSLLILGTGSKENEMNLLGDKLLPGRFKIRSVTHEQMPQFLSSCDAVVLAPIERESFGISLVEALSCGKFVVTTDDPTRREIVGGAGIFVNPQNIAEFAEAIKHVLTMKDSKIPLAQASKFSWDEIASKYQLLMENL